MFSAHKASTVTRRRKVRRKRTFPWQWIAAIVAACVVLSVGVYFLFLRPYSAERALRKTEVTENWVATADTLFYTDGATLHSTTFSNQQKWSATTIKEGMKVAAKTGGNVAVYLGQQLQCFDASGTLRYAKEFYGEILNVRCGTSFVAVHVKETSGAYRLIVLDNSGAETNLTIEGGYVVDFDYFGEDNLYVYAIDSASMTPSSILSIYNNQLAATGKINVSGQILQKTLFFTNSIYVIGSTYLQEMGYLGEVNQQKLIYGWNYAGIHVTDGGKATVAFIPGGTFAEAEGITTVRLCTFGENDVYLQMKPDVSDVFLKNGKLFSISDDILYVYSLGGTLQNSYALPFVPKDILVLADANYAALTGEDGVYLLKLP